MRRSRSVVVVVVPALLALASCKKGVPAPEPMDPVSHDEAKAFATAFAAAAAPCDVSKVDRLLDGESVVRRALQRSKVRGALRDGIARGLRSRSLGTMICQGMSDDARYVLLKIDDVAGAPHPVFRLLSDGAVNYHELELGKSRKDHQVRAVDIRVFATGDMLSESLAQMMDQAEAVTRTGADAAQFQRTVQGIQDARQSGDNAEARRLLATIPAPMRAAKPIRLAELMIASDQDETTYGEVMERYRRDFPGDPSADVVAIDYFYLRKDLPRTLAAVESLDARVGGDPYLANLRASAYLLDPTPEHLAEAERWARKGVEAVPDDEDALWSLAAILLMRGDHAAVLPVADTLRTRFAATIDPTAMAGNELWAAHFASDAYQQSLAH
jgi:hypothetical protein